MDNPTQFTKGMATQRLVIYPKDIVLITGKSERYCRYLIKHIKAHYGKESHQSLTIREFCEYMGLEYDEVAPIIK